MNGKVMCSSCSLKMFQFSTHKLPFQCQLHGFWKGCCFDITFVLVLFLYFIFSFYFLKMVLILIDFKNDEIKIFYLILTLKFPLLKPLFHSN